MISTNAHQSKAIFMSFLLVSMSISLFRLFGFYSLLKLVIETKKNKLIAVQYWYVPTRYTQNVWSSWKMFLWFTPNVSMVCLSLTLMRKLFYIYAFLKAQSYMVLYHVTLGACHNSQETKYLGCPNSNQIQTKHPYQAFFVLFLGKKNYGMIC